jgi:RimJ/RimL family protein N-acetyltransferase
MFAVTQRLLLRPGWADDAQALHSAIAHESVVNTLAQLPWPYTINDARHFLSLPRGGDDPVFVILDRTQGRPRLVGGVGIHDAPDGTGPEIGYWITPDCWGRGFATEAARAVVEIARHTLRMERLSACHFIDNPASGAVLRKAGFRPTGQIRPRWCNARRCDVPSVQFSLNLQSDSDAEGDAVPDMPRLAA